MNAVYFVAAVLAAYFVGALPTAVIVAGRAKGINILEHGSGNPGASNVFRVLGPQWAMVTLGVDVFKGYLPTWLVGRVAEHLIVGGVAESPVVVQAWVAFAAFAGHVKSPFLRFKGGKGAATMLGGMFALAPQATTLTILVYAAVLFLAKKFAAATLIAALTFPFLLVWREGGGAWGIFWWGMLVPALLIVTHHSNIRRMLGGRELGTLERDKDVATNDSEEP